MAKKVNKRKPRYTKEQAEAAHTEVIETAVGPTGLKVYPSALAGWYAMGFNIDTDITDENLAKFLTGEFHRLGTYSCFKTTSAFISRALMLRGLQAFNRTTFYKYPNLLQAREAILKNPNYTRAVKNQVKQFTDEDCILLLEICHALYYDREKGWQSQNDEAVQIAAVIVLCTFGSFRGDDLAYIHCCDVAFTPNPASKKLECRVEMVNLEGDSGPKSGKRKPEHNDGKHKMMICTFVCCCSDPDVAVSYLMNARCPVHILLILTEALPDNQSNLKILRNRNAKSKRFTRSNMGRNNYKSIATRMNDLLPAPYDDNSQFTLKSLKRNGITHKLRMNHGDALKVSNTTRHCDPEMVKRYNEERKQEEKQEDCREVSAQLGEHFEKVAGKQQEAIQEARAKLADEVKQSDPELHQKLTATTDPYDELLDNDDVFKEAEENFNAAMAPKPAASTTRAVAVAKPRYDVMMKPKMYALPKPNEPAGTFTAPHPPQGSTITKSTHATPFAMTKRPAFKFDPNPNKKKLGGIKKTEPPLTASQNVFQNTNTPTSGCIDVDKTQQDNQNELQKLQRELMAARALINMHTQKPMSNTSSENIPYVETPSVKTPLTAETLSMLPEQYPMGVRQTIQQHVTAPSTTQSTPHPQQTTINASVTNTEHQNDQSLNVVSAYPAFAQVQPLTNFTNMTPQMLAYHQQLQLQQLLQSQAAQQQQFLQQATKEKEQTQQTPQTTMHGCTVTINHNHYKP